MANINLAGDRLFNLSAPIEPATIIGPGEQYQLISDIPAGLLYPGKQIFDKATNTLYIVNSQGDPLPSNKPDIIQNSFTGIHVLHQSEYDQLLSDNQLIPTVLYLIKSPNP